MTTVAVTVHHDGDGYLTVDTAEWMRDRMARDDALTESLREWLRVRDDDVGDKAACYFGADGWMYYAREPEIMRWAHFTLRGAPTLVAPGPGEFFPDGGEMATYNEGDQLLSEEIGAVWIPTDDGTMFVQHADGAYGTLVPPTVHRVTCAAECLADHRTCQAECSGPDRHQYDVEGGGIYLSALDGSRATVKVSEQARVALGGQRQWIACPAEGCARALRFEMFVW
jgi:hypothetical protein